MSDRDLLRYSCEGHLNRVADNIVEWSLKKGFETKWGNIPEKLMLIVSELSEALEAHRKLTYKLDVDLQPLPKEDEHLANFREELADAQIRLLDLSASLGIDLELEVMKKMAKNERRPHKHGKNY